MNNILKHDIQEFCSSFLLADYLQNTCFLITGATGLIGSTFVHCLLALDKGISIIAPVRNAQKMHYLFDSKELESIDFFESDLIDEDYSHIKTVDFIIHCAAPTSSRFFVEKPVETFDFIIKSTSNLLDYAKKKDIKSFVFLSSLEVYGTIDKMDTVTEDVQGYWSITDIRSSYPIAKRAAENLCYLYSQEYFVPVKIARLTQTTGAAVAKDDNRVIVQFARLAAKGEDIILHTTGESARPYCYTTDAISALLYILLKGKRGEAYNVANPQTYISAKGLAEYLRDNYNKNINIKYELNNNEGYAPISLLPLSVEKLKTLGWVPKYGLRDMFDKLMECLC